MRSNYVMCQDLSAKTGKFRHFYQYWHFCPTFTISVAFLIFYTHFFAQNHKPWIWTPQENQHLLKSAEMFQNVLNSCRFPGNLRALGNCLTVQKQFKLSGNKPAEQATGKDPPRCNSTNRQNSPVQQNRRIFLTNNAI